MEPADLNSDRDAALEAWLRRAHHPLADDGFSQRVLAALPPPPSRAGRRFRLCVSGAVLGVFVTISSGSSWADLTRGAGEVRRSMAEMAPLAADPWFVLALLIIGFALAYAFRSSADPSPLS